MSTVFTSTIYNSLKETLDEIIDDAGKGYSKGLIFPKWCTVKNMKDYYEDDLEMGGPGLASEVAEGSPLVVGGIQEGVLTRYISRKFGLKMVVTEEAIDDTKYDRVINAAPRLIRALYKTADIDATNMLVRGFNSAYPGSDGVSLFSNAHTLPGGGTYSNTLATPMTPSRAAVIQITSMARKLPGHDGVTEGYETRDVLCPTEQWAVWEGVVKSEKAPEPGQFNEINVARDVIRNVIPIKYWNNTTTNFAITLDCENGLNFRWRRKPRSRSWVDEDNEVMNYGISARWDRRWSDARSIIGSNA
jgi:hypothetical protein